MTQTEAIVAALTRAHTSYEAARRHLGERIGSGDDHRSLADALVNLAEREGAYHAWQNIAQVFPSLDGDRVVRYLLMLATAHPDDTYSGRTNDARRAYTDGKRSAVQDARGLLNLT